MPILQDLVSPDTDHNNSPDTAHNNLHLEGWSLAPKWKVWAIKYDAILRPKEAQL